MKLIIGLLLSVAAFSFISCAPLNPNNSTLQDVGEITGRVLLCPLTLCMSEVGFKMNYEDEQRRRAYQQWYQGLSGEQQDREDRREAARLFGLGLALSGGGPFRNFSAPLAPAYQPVPVPTYQPRQPTNCTTSFIGNQAYTNCQ